MHIESIDMNGSDAIAKLPELNRDLNALRAHLADESDEIGERWEALASIGAGRDDHAAALVARLRPHLEALRGFAERCIVQVDAIAADPFGDERASVGESDPLGRIREAYAQTDPDRPGDGRTLSAADFVDSDPRPRAPVARTDE